METAAKEHVAIATKLYEEWKEMRERVLAARKATTDAQVSLETLSTALPGVDVTSFQESIDERKEESKKDLYAYERKTLLLRGLRELTANVIHRLQQVYNTLDLELDVTVSKDRRLTSDRVDSHIDGVLKYEKRLTLGELTEVAAGPKGYAGAEWWATTATTAP